MKINKLRKVSYPKEHGSWGFLIEPLLLSLLIAYTCTGFLLAISTFIIFLAHQPVRILLNYNDKDLKQAAFIVLVIYSALVLFLLTTILNQIQPAMLLLFLSAIVMMFFFLVLELFKLGRHLIVEFIAPVAISLIGVNIALFYSWGIYELFALGIVLLSRAIPTVFYVNAKIMIVKKLKTKLLPLRLSEFLFLFAIIFLAFYKLVPYLSILAILILIIRSYIGLKHENRNEKAKQIGIKEFVFGFLFVIINAIGYLLNL